MYSPEQQTFIELVRHFNLVPVYRTIIADLDTPLTLFAKIAGEDSHAFLFESMEGGEKWGRYSFIGFDPLLVFTSVRDQVEIRFPEHAGKDELRSGVQPLDELRRLLASFVVPDTPGPARFYGGAVGFLGYDMVRFMEHLPDRHPVSALPDSSFLIPRMVLIHDAVQQKLTIVCNVRAQNPEDAVHLYADACQRIDAVVDRLQQPIDRRRIVQKESVIPHRFTANMDEAAFK
ncbi:MAG: anthranilate synthase component I, partial [Desulfobulbus sp.]|nr:anthranilate synthase component I [Desulfobulbus sp.]